MRQECVTSFFDKNNTFTILNTGRNFTCGETLSWQTEELTYVMYATEELIRFFLRTAYYIHTAPDSGIFERGDSPLAVIYSITNILFSNEII